MCVCVCVLACYLSASMLRATDMPHICQNCHVTSHMHGMVYAYAVYVHTNKKYIFICMCIFFAVSVLCVRNRENYLSAFMALLSFTAPKLAVDNGTRHCPYTFLFTVNKKSIPTKPQVLLIYRICNRNIE